MNVIITTLSLGINYTKDYCLRLIEDVLLLSDCEIYVTTDCSHLIHEKFPNNSRIKIKEINRENLKIRIPIGKTKFSSDFNFNMRYLCLEHVQNVPNSIVIFTDCDNSFNSWDKQKVFDFIQEKKSLGFDFYGPRTDWKFKDIYEIFDQKCKGNPDLIDLNTSDCTMMWHKFFNYDLVNPNTLKVKEGILDELRDSPLPAEYLLIFDNREYKLRKFVEKWKYLHDYLVNKDYSYGTWAEGFEIGVSSNFANFKDFDITFNHPLWSEIFTANGYKTGPRGGIVHATEH